ncbi:ROK family transcriptional regulator [Agrococcus carbonis]|uniref:Sugar kinase of the NBD/HSP70 family, may contain an N-terminal HTH domain n=1 Tax=Agrococcus carbonis TaxID=684552 RepID=A0A1H1NY99_9MICO|nr:ROK family protein [Agrococcus carbonis]SDS03927.1 Sugar kinase of the NBD/HSP70 family, may contain an N-terminal HTH domain [Agrococcus carbonis]
MAQQPRPKPGATGSGVVLDLIRSGAATTRSALIEQLGWSRVTLAKRLDELLAAGIIVQAGLEDSGGGRPASAFAVAKDAGLLLAMDIGGSHTRVGVTDLVSTVLCESEADIGLYDGPDDIFAWAMQVFEHLLLGLGGSFADVRGIGIGVPGPVDSETGTLGSPQLDPRWDDVRIADFLGPLPHGVVVTVDRDANILAIGEARLAWPEHRDLVVVKAGIGVGCALVLDGSIHRGSRGGSGQLSAPLRTALSEPLRRLETVASGGTIREQLARDERERHGVRIRTSADIVALVADGDSEAVAAIEEAGEEIGYTIADVVGLLNPSAVVIGGNLAEAGDRFVGAIRRSLFRAGHAFSKQGLVVERARLGNRAGVRGASLLAQDALFEAARISELTRGTPSS